mmetsp:Transcript_26028/g.77185  ORF Transcript_26028/g.77185 Transcript_26028/m.77185 type:complete len:82 (-) Transcript_26028:623-868(-)|eukprot:366497-Chlamydomonas_euryale.AAC.4
MERRVPRAPLPCGLLVALRSPRPPGWAQQARLSRGGSFWAAALPSSQCVHSLTPGVLLAAVGKMSAPLRHRTSRPSNALRE